MPERTQPAAEATNPDVAQRFLFEHLPVRGNLVHLNDSWRQVLARSRPPAPAQPMLGEALCAAALLATHTKFAGTIGLQVQGAGSVRLLHAQCSHDGKVRGIVRGEGAASPIDAGRGLLAINLAPPNGGNTYQGIVSLDPAGIAPSLECYFRQSEQLETRFWLMAGEQSCLGLMLQRLPGQNATDADWERLIGMARALTLPDLAGLDTEELLIRLFGDELLRVFTASPLTFGCSCSARRVAEVLQALGRDEVLDVVAERGDIEVVCEYCGTAYTLDRVDAAALFERSDTGCTETSAVH